MVRLTTDAPLSYIVNEVTFPLTRPMSLFFGQDDPLRSAMDTTSREFLDRTREHWLDWVRNLAIPLEWQKAVIRAAITLKMCSFEETGAIVAAHTTSIPEAPSTGEIGTTATAGCVTPISSSTRSTGSARPSTMEDYLNYIATIAAETGPIKPVHSIVPFEPLEERIAPDLQGFHGFGPVRVGNQAVEQIQNDVYGSVILSVTQMFVDERLPRMGDEGLFRRLEWLGEKAFALAFEADAGPWEFRGRAERAHLFGDHVLGRLRSARPDCATARPRRPRPLLARQGAHHSRAHSERRPGIRSARRSPARWADPISTPACC